MAQLAWACQITRPNQAAIASENPKFNLEEFNQWLRDHEVAYFIRDPGSPFDCRYMSEVVFSQMYIFEKGDESVLFRQIIKID